MVQFSCQLDIGVFFRISASFFKGWLKVLPISSDIGVLLDLRRFDLTPDWA